MRIPFVDLKAQYKSLQPELDAAILRVVADGAFIGGRYAAEFERSFAEYLGTSHCIGVANGTDAIEIGLRAIGIVPGDEVLVPANTFFATAEAVENVGAKCVFVDIDAPTFNLDPAKIEAAITPKTKAIIPVHLYGLPADMNAIVEMARNHNLKILEDCAQAHGATFKGKKVGTFGDAATFSFYPSKNLGAFGDAGAVVTNSADVAGLAQAIANHGQPTKNRHTMIGRNSRLDGIQGSVLSTKLPHLDEWIEAKRSRARLYDKLLTDSGLVLPTDSENARHTYHLYVIQVENRESVQAKLAAAEIETGIHYPIAIPYLEPFKHLGHSPDDFPVAYSQMGKLLSLPMYAELTDEMIETVCKHLRLAISDSAGAIA
jgi:dTDP-4-amino-4,6-dideoxygalactose transaminase